MKPESDPILDEEWLLRRVRIERFRTDIIPLISPNAFEPRTTGRDIDQDGISLYRLACLSSPEEILATVAEDKRDKYGIVRVSVSFLKSLDLAVESRPDARIPGHVVIRELNAQAYSTDKSLFKLILLRLAEAASAAENIVRCPTAKT